MWLSLGLVLAPIAARAQGGDAAAALSLFEEGRRQMSAGNYAEGCPRLLSSYSMLPKLGTLLNLADCYEKAGKTASAWARFTEAASLAERASQPDRAEFAKSHAEALVPKLSRLQIDLTTSVAGLVVNRDGSPTDPSIFGVAIPVDPGKHSLEASAPGKKPWSGSVDVVGEATVAKILIPALDEAPVVVAPPLATAAAPAVRDEVDESRGNSQRTWGLIAGGTGLVALGGSLVLGAVANSQYDKSNGPSLCIGDECTTNGTDKRDQASGTAGLATGVFIGGLVLLTAGVALYFTAPRASSRRTTFVLPGAVRGVF